MNDITGATILIVDRNLQAMAVEKTARNYFETYGPDSNGRCYISGMACRDYTTPQGRHVIAKRNEYCRGFGLSDDAIDRHFWKLCDDMEAMLAQNIATLPSGVPAADVCTLFATPYPGGLCMDHLKCHPAQAATSNTVVTYATAPGSRRYYRWQRSADGETWPTEAEVCQY
jgi:hypothetical protein